MKDGRMSKLEKKSEQVKLMSPGPKGEKVLHLKRQDGWARHQKEKENIWMLLNVKKLYNFSGNAIQL